jgi:hypothetical protein
MSRYSHLLQICAYLLAFYADSQQFGKYNRWQDALINIKTRLVGDLGYFIELVEKRNTENEHDRKSFWAVLAANYESWKTLNLDLK